MSLSAGYYPSAAPVVTDWANVISFTPGTYLAPASVADLEAILTAVLASRPEKSLRFLGGLHSCSDILESEIVVDTSQVQPLNFDISRRFPGGAEVVASAFMTVHDFLAEAARHNLSLTSTGGTDAQTLAGLISTNTAGATSHHRIYDLLKWVEYLTVAPGGRAMVLRRVARGHADFRAVVCSLGVIGCLTQVCFRLVDERFFEATFEIRKLTDVLSNPVATSEKYEFWRIEWIPKKDVGLFWSANRIDPPQDRDGDYENDKAEDILKTAQKWNQKLWHNGAFSNGSLNLIYDALLLIYQQSTARGPLRHMIPCDRRAVLHVAMAEWSFRPADLDRAMAACRVYFEKSRWPNMPIEIECTPTDDYMMSPWRWPELDSPFIMKFNFQYLTDFLDDSEKRGMMAHLRGLWEYLETEHIPFKAHWGKIHFWNRDTVVPFHDYAAFRPYAHPMFSNSALRALGIP